MNGYFSGARQAKFLFLASLHLSEVGSGGQTVRGCVAARLAADRFRDRRLVFNSYPRKSFPHASFG
jgi:hypothetical protein